MGTWLSKVLDTELKRRKWRIADLARHLDGIANPSQIRKMVKDNQLSNVELAKEIIERLGGDFSRALPDYDPVPDAIKKLRLDTMEEIKVGSKDREALLLKEEPAAYEMAALIQKYATISEHRDAVRQQDHLERMKRIAQIRAELDRLLQEIAELP